MPCIAGAGPRQHRGPLEVRCFHLANHERDPRTEREPVPRGCVFQLSGSFAGPIRSSSRRAASSNGGRSWSTVACTIECAVSK